MASQGPATSKRGSAAHASATSTGSPRSGARVLLVPLAAAVALLLLGGLFRGQPVLAWTLAGAGLAVVAWAAAVHAAARAAGRLLAIDVVIRRQHWVQACAQTAILLYWGWHVRFVYAFLPLILAQIVFAYAVDSLLTWARRDRYALGFGPFPVVLSINLFLWFRPDWFYWQFAMILVGYAAKEFIKWTREGRRAHIFNPSSFPLAVASILLILTASSDITFGTAIATTQFYPPHMYLLIFLVSVPGQLLFGVARMTLSAVVSLFLISEVFLQATGTYLFFDSHIPLPVFLGMHLLFTDPSTSPRSGTGRVLFGAMYASGTALFYVMLSGMGVPTFYDKLLPVPLMNLTVRAIDRLVASGRLSLRRGAPVEAQPVMAPAPAAAALPGSVAPPAGIRRSHVVYTGMWAVAFLALSAVRALGDNHPGQALPFWQEACRAGSERACTYTTAMTGIYCDNGSGWACYDWGIRRIEARQPAGRAFARACELGYAPGCDWTASVASGAVAATAVPPRAMPALADWPIVLRGTKPPLSERDPQRLLAIACAQGWPDTCAPRTATP